MKKPLLILCFLTMLCFPTPAYAPNGGLPTGRGLPVGRARPQAEEADGSPSGFYWKHIYPDNSITDNLDGTINFDFYGSISADLLPDTTCTYDIGSSSLYWKDGFFNGTITADTFFDGTLSITAGNLTTTGTITSGDITIFDATPILVFQDSNSAGAASVGFIEWKDSGGGRAGFLGNNSSGNDDLYWKNEQGGNIGIETTGAGNLNIIATLAQFNATPITTTGELFTNDTLLSDDSPKYVFYDNDDGSSIAYAFHLDTDASNAPWQNFAFWRGTSDGTDFNVSPNTPFWYADDTSLYLNRVATIKTAGTTDILSIQPDATGEAVRVKFFENCATGDRPEIWIYGFADFYGVQDYARIYMNTFGILNFRGMTSTLFDSSIKMNDDYVFTWGSGNDLLVGWYDSASVATKNYFKMEFREILASNSKTIVLSDATASEAVQEPPTVTGYPTFDFHDGSTTQNNRGRIYHNGTDFYVESLTGTINLNDDNLTTTGDITAAKVGVGTSATLDSLFEVDGAEGLAIETVTGNTTLDNTHSTLLVNASGNVTITLPTAASAYNNTDGIGRIYWIKKIDDDADTVTVDGNGSETIDDALTFVITSYLEVITIQSDGTEWWII